MPRSSGILETATRLARGSLALGVVAHALALRWFLLEREACLAALDRFGRVACVVDAWLWVAAIVHGASLVVHARSVDAGRPGMRDRFVLLFSSFAFALSLFAMHSYYGPLGAAIRGYDAYGTYEEVRRGFSTVFGAATHSLGLVAVVLHVYETIRISRPASLRPAIAAVLAATLLAVQALDPIANVTIGRPLFGRRPNPGGGMIFPTDSATLAPR